MRKAWAIAVLAAGSLIGAGATAGETAPSKPTFEAFGRDLAAFAKAAEAYCGFSPGAALKVPRRNMILIQLAEPKGASYKQFMCLIDTLNTENLERNGV